jgi:hypothetical protein
MIADKKNISKKTAGDFTKKINDLDEKISKTIIAYGIRQIKSKH